MGKRLGKALESARWTMGATYEKKVTTRAGKEVTCIMRVTDQGFEDQDKVLWETPSALTTSFVIKYCGSSAKTRRPAGAFFGISPDGTKKERKRRAKKEKVVAVAQPSEAPAPAVSPVVALPLIEL